MEIFHYTFMQRAFIAGSFVSMAASMLGILMVLRRESMVGHGLSHATFAGVAIGLVSGVQPVLTALVVAILGAFFIVRLKEISGLGGDTGIGIISSVGMAAGIVIVTLARDLNVDLLSYLFGSILTIQRGDVVISCVLAGFTIGVFCWFYHELIYMIFDHESARASGINVDFLELLVGFITAVTVVIGMRVVGLLLITAMMVIPAATALIIGRSLKSALWIAAAIGILTVMLGLFIAFYLNIPASGTIVLLQAAMLAGSLAYKSSYRRENVEGAS